MLAQGFLSPIETTRSALQEQIGLFLSGRAKLNRLMGNPQLGIQGQARGLYSVQATLEDRLQNEITPMIKKVSSGVWDSSDILSMTGFTWQIKTQIDAVNSLERQAGGVPASSMFDMDMIGILAAGTLIVLGMGVIGGVLFERKN